MWQQGGQRKVLQRATATRCGDEEEEERWRAKKAQKKLAPRKKREKDVQHRGERGFIQVQGERD